MGPLNYYSLVLFSVLSIYGMKPDDDFILTTISVSLLASSVVTHAHITTKGSRTLATNVFKP